MRRFLTILSLIGLVFIVLNPRVFSQTASPTPTSTPTSTPTPTPTPSATSTPTPTPSPEPETSTLEDRILEIMREQAEVQQKLNILGKEKRTLQSTIAILDNQIRLTNLEIERTTQELSKLENEIAQINQTLDQLKIDLAKIQQVLVDRVRATYKKGNLTAVEILFSSDSFSEFVNRFKYLQIIQANDRQVLYQTQAARATFTDQKAEKEKKEAEVSSLKAKIEAENSNLRQQKAEKDRLLAITRNDERRFQGMLVELQAELDSIKRALGNVSVKIGPVEKGERIAAVGNNGCSTGPHLHFEVMLNAKVEGNSVVGRENKVDPKPYLDGGRLGKPLTSYNGKDWPEGNITTHFGEVYFLGVHTGLDMADSLGTPIYSADKGTAYFLTDPRPCYLTGTVGKGIVVDHGNGTVTLYWHIL